MILFDTNVIVDVLRKSETWFDWSAAQLNRARETGAVPVVDVTIAELAVGFASASDLHAVVDRLSIVPRPMTLDGLYLAGQAFKDYRARGGARSSVLADFFIGAHAVDQGVPLVTRDAARYRTYFPNIMLVTPER